MLVLEHNCEHKYKYMLIVLEMILSIKTGILIL